MNIYSQALKAYLEGPDAGTQSDFADRAQCTQAAISRYAKALRFPTREIAERIDAASAGKVPMSLWRVVAAEKAGLAA